MNRKIVLVAWALCSVQAFGMIRRSAGAPAAAGSAALSSVHLPWMRSASAMNTTATATPLLLSSEAATTDAPGYSGLSAMLWGQDSSSRFTMPKFNKRAFIAPVVLGGVEAYHYYNDQIRDEKLTKEQAKVAMMEEKLAKEQAMAAWLSNELQKQKQEAKKGFNEIEAIFEQTPNDKIIPNVLSAYDTWISKLHRGELNEEFRMALGQYIFAREGMFDRKWNALKYVYMSKNDIRMRDADKLEMDNEFTKMSQVLDNVTDGTPFVNNQVLTKFVNNQDLAEYLKSMKKDVLRDKVEQAWWLNTLSMPAGAVDKWLVRRNA
ncbi:MAG: hypothetical protein NTZ68_00560 [Candidatus Dependentiae bacterium]|nr:hypothetical protein [Candidatus Dependentiae bacterium]